MFNLGLDFDQPWYLLLLVLIPLLWIFSYRSLSGLGSTRRFLAIAFRTIVLLLLIAALAEIQLKRTSEQITVFYLLDQSESIPLAKRQAMVNYVAQEVKAHRQDKDQAGVIAFGRDATIEVPPFDADIPNAGRVESDIGRLDATNLESALKLAQASFPEGSVKRIVVVTDGNENIGNARGIAPQLARNGIGIDVVPVKLATRSEIVVDKVVVPPDIRQGQPMDVKVSLQNYSEDHPVRGRLRVVKKAGKLETLIAEEEVVLPPGKTVLAIPHQIDTPGAFNFGATFAPNDPQDDLMNQNNQIQTFVHVAGKGRVLLIEDFTNSGEFDYLVQRLRQNEIEVDVMPSNELFTSLVELQAYDSVILANVPQNAGDEKDVVTFSTEQIAMLVRNTEHFGSGLVMLGGPNSFGAGGWANTELEKAMPVDFQIKNAKVQAVGALVCLMHASELAQGNYWQQVVARESVKSLGPMDYAGLLHFDDFGADAWLWGRGLMRVGGEDGSAGNRRMMLTRIERMNPGDMPAFDPAMRMALTGFRNVNASVKHMIIISDGDPQPPVAATLTGFKSQGIKISTVAIGTHGAAGSTVLKNIAVATGGKYYEVNNPKVLPKIYQREVRTIARPLIYEPDGGVVPQLGQGVRHEILQGISAETLPPVSGFVLTTVKEDNPLVEVAAYSSKPEPQNGTILAAWTYGAGRTVAFTSDAGKRWATQWTSWDNYDKFFTQMVRWSMRPSNQDGKYTVATDVKDGRVRVAITAFDAESGEFINGQSMSAVAVGPTLQPVEVKVRQVAPGRYVGEFAAEDAGSYQIAVVPEKGMVLAGADVPYSSEFRERETNRALLEALAATPPAGGEVGKVIDGDLSPEGMQALLGVDTFREGLAKAISTQDVWPLFVLFAAGAFLADVFIRRVSIGYEWIAPLVNFVRERILRQTRNEAVDQTIERLRSRKAAIQSQIDERRSATRFEPQADPETPARGLDDVLGEVAGSQPTEPSRTARPAVAPAASAEDQDYTARLLAAKKKVQKERGNSAGPS